MDVALLDGRGAPQTVERASAASAPVAFVRVEDLGAVLWLSPCETCDDPWTAADIHVYKHVAGTWVDAGGGGSDWDWHGVEAPEQDSDSMACFSTPLSTGRRVCLIPRYVPTGPGLGAKVDHSHDW